jgi:predicted Fe-S protein YdhL (DUF1289 family)
MAENYISVIDVAKEVGKAKQTVFKVPKRLDIESQKMRGPDNRGQLIAYITQEEFTLVKAEIQNMRGGKSDASESEIPELGVFYVVQLEPDHDPGRFKVGFASNMAERLRTHRCSAPFSKVLKTWPCRSMWEKTAIDCVCDGCERLHTEVFRIDSIDKVITKCDEFFAIMPSLQDRNQTL